jgi:hypothetical protein
MIQAIAATPPAAPADTARTGDGAVQQAFQKILFEQVAKSLVATAGSEGNPYAALIPTALADEVTT